MEIHACESLASFYCKLNVKRLLAQLSDFALAQVTFSQDSCVSVKQN